NSAVNPSGGWLCSAASTAGSAVLTAQTKHPIAIDKRKLITCKLPVQNLNGPAPSVPSKRERPAAFALPAPRGRNGSHYPRPQADLQRKAGGRLNRDAVAWGAAKLDTPAADRYSSANHFAQARQPKCLRRSGTSNAAICS